MRLSKCGAYRLIMVLFAIFCISGKATAEDSPSGTKQFAGINFGVGISLTHDIGENDRIKSAVIDEAGIVRVTEDQNNIARVMLESHFFFDPKDHQRSFLGLVPPERWGHGPYVALQPGTEEIIEAIGLGWMVGFLRTEDSTDSWNLGVGYVIDPSVQILGGGLEENMPLPEGEAQIRYKNTSQSGIFILASFSF